MHVLEPGEKYIVEIPGRPTKFTATHLSMREQRVIMNAYDSWFSPDVVTDEAFRQTMGAFKLVIVGWTDGFDLKTGERVRFEDEGIDGIDRIIDLVDARMLCLRLLRNGRPDANEKKE